MSDLEAVVLRTRGEGGDFKFYVAKLHPQEAKRLERQLAAGEFDATQITSFGNPVDLPQAMSLIDTRDFQVFDVAC